MAESKTARNPGWYAGIGAFWLIAAWLVVAGLSSIIPQIFGHSVEGSQSTDTCVRSLTEEKAALFDRMGAALALPGQGRDALDEYLREWDMRVRGLAETCPARPAQAADELLRMRHALRDAVSKLDREQGPRLKHFTSLLRQP